MLKEIVEKNAKTTIGLIVIFICHLKTVFHLSDITDVLLEDESRYIRAAMDLDFSGSYKDGFIYYIWYKFIHIFSYDLINLYVLNRAVLMGLNGYMIFLILLKARVNYLISIAVAVVFTISKINSDIWPFITQFALFVSLLTFYVSMYFKDIRKILLVWNLGFLLLLYIRPELTVAFALSLVCSIGILVYDFIKARRKYNTNQFTVNQLLIGVILGIFIIIGSPMSKGRSSMAFGQHFSLNYVASKELKISPWTHWKKIMTGVFSTKESMATAFKNNRRAFLKHTSINAEKFKAQWLFHLRPSSIKRGIFKKVYKIIARLYIIIVVIALVKYLYGIFKKRKIDISDHKIRLSLFAALLFSPIVLSVILIYPRDHYVIILVGVMLILSMSFVNALLIKVKFNNNIIAAALIIALIISVPYKVSGTIGLFPGKIAEQSKKTNIKIIRGINALELKNTTILIFKNTALGTFLDKRYEVVKLPKNVDSLSGFIENSEVNVILITKLTIKHAQAENNSMLLEFIRNPPPFLIKHNLNEENYLLMKNQDAL